MNGCYPIVLSRNARMGSVKSDSNVVMKMTCVMRCSSRPYFRQNIMPLAATGIPVSTTATLVTKGLKGKSWKKHHTITGIAKSLSPAMLKTNRLPIMSRGGRVARVAPIRIKAHGMVMSPTRWKN